QRVSFFFHFMHPTMEKISSRLKELVLERPWMPLQLWFSLQLHTGSRSKLFHTSFAGSQKKPLFVFAPFTRSSKAFSKPALEFNAVAVIMCSVATIPALKEGGLSVSVLASIFTTGALSSSSFSSTRI